MWKFGTICVGMEVGKLELVQDLVGLISFRDRVFEWLSLEKTFTRLLEFMKAAEKRIAMSDIAAMLSRSACDNVHVYVIDALNSTHTYMPESSTARLETASGDSADDHFERNMPDF
ncbi:hypothetical protein BGZ98_010093 [Dissophora globulifera]|nr:hypothetical protein BGZ98_010093 [Dissophora globulifera]